MKHHRKNHKNHEVPTIANRSARQAVDQAIQEGKLFVRDISIREDSMNEDARTVDIVFSTGAEYRQWWGRETLVVSKEACRLDRLNAPYSAFLLNHDKNKQIGTVVRAWIDNGEALATVRFSRSPLGEEIFQDVRDNIRGQFSNGYRILKYEIDESNPNDPLYKITDWEPYELSLVAFAADTKGSKT